MIEPQVLITHSDCGEVSPLSTDQSIAEREFESMAPAKPDGVRSTITNCLLPVVLAFTVEQCFSEMIGPRSCRDPHIGIDDISKVRLKA